MRSIEAEGASIDEAIEKALAALRVARDQVEIEILENTTRGLFGLGSRRSRIRATVRPTLDSLTGSGEQAPVVSRETATSEAARREAGVAAGYEPPVADAVGARDGASARARKFLEAVLVHLVDSPGVELLGPGSDGGSVRLSLSGAESGMIIGRRGQTLDALEHLVNRIVFRDEAEPGVRIALDVEGYRDRRQESLEHLARRLAAKAKETGRVVTLNPMSPRDRRTVHLALQSDPRVTTRSEGDGQFRRLVILPQGGRRGGEGLGST